MSNGRSAKRKGDGYERELAKWLDAKLFGGSDTVQRMPLSGGGRHVGGGGKADLLGTPDVWIEAKRTERFTPYANMDQAETGIKGARTTDVPVVVTRRNRMSTEESLICMRLGDWVEMYASYLRERGYKISEADDEDQQMS
jgi:Holliday junction resolvase